MKGEKVEEGHERRENGGRTWKMRKWRKYMKGEKVEEGQERREVEEGHERRGSGGRTWKEKGEHETTKMFYKF